MTTWKKLIGTILNSFKLGFNGNTLDTNANRVRIRNTNNTAFSPLVASRLDSETTIRLNSEIVNNYTIQAPNVSTPCTLLLPANFPSTGSSFMRVNSTGAITADTTPELIVRKIGTQSFPNNLGATGLVTWQNILTDNFNRFNTVNSSYTIPQSGLYLVSLSLQVFMSPDIIRIVSEMMVNGTVRQKIYDFELTGNISTNINFINVQKLVRLANNDVVTIRFVQSSRNNASINIFNDVGFEYLNELIILRIV